MSTSQGVTLDAFLTRVSVQVKKDFTDEQIEFARDFTSPILSFSLPGTGKTETAVLGLIATELYHKIPGKNIYAASFTRISTLELEQRHQERCQQLGIRPTVNFKTLSSLCSGILKKYYPKLGFSSLKISEALSIKEMGEFLLETAKDAGINLNPYDIRKVINAIRTLNSSLTFDRPHVETKMAFKQTKLSYEDFQYLRKAAYDLNKVLETVQVSDIFLYTLELLIKNPEISQELKREIRVMLMDEFQDMSLLQLKLISLMTDNCIAIGDIRQQIYGFNGACQEIEAKYKEYYPNYREVSLTQSFRCGEKIARYGTDIILHNKNGGENFKGKVGVEGKITFNNQGGLDKLCEDIYNKYIENRRVFKKSLMFIFRNNFSIIPLAENLYKYKIPFQVSNTYKPAHQIPVIKDLCAIVELARNPTTASYTAILSKLIPEFSNYKDYRDIPLAKIMLQTGQNLFEINYQFKEANIGAKVMTTLMEVKELLASGSMLVNIFQLIYPLYEPYLQRTEHFLEQPANYYTSLVVPLVENKTYQMFTTDELKKAEFIEECTTQRKGIKCYTMHGSKGTEADIVHLIDINEGIVPNTSKIDEMIQAGCVIDAAREIRNERCLAYVAATRAKEELIIHHSGTLASIFSTINTFESLDRAYETYVTNYSDVEVFEEFTR